MKVLGVDPGVHGGLAIIATDGNCVPQVIAAIDVPLVGVKAKERVDVIALQEWLLQNGPDHALIERGQAMPRQVFQLRLQIRASRRRNRDHDRAVRTFPSRSSKPADGSGIFNCTVVTKKAPDSAPC